MWRILMPNISEIDSLFNHSKEIQFPNRSIILAQGQNIDQLFYLVKGRVKLYVISPDGRERILQFINSGDTFGEPSIFTGVPNGFMAMALEPCTVKTLQKQKIIDLIRCDPNLAELLIHSISYKLLQLGKLLANKSLDMPETVAKTLIDLLEQNKNNKDKKAIQITHQQLGDYLGVSRASISSNLQILEDEGFIERKRESIEIINITGLKQWTTFRHTL
jgi:CRP-like cAMP-binding protein